VRSGLIAFCFAFASIAVLMPPFAAEAVTSHSCGAERQLVGDVDGDGLRDRVLLRARWVEEHGCRFRLIVRGRRDRYSLRLREGLLEAPRVSPEARVAALRGLARIDRRSGSEILVELNRGASSSGVAVYSILRGRLHHVRLRSGDGLFWEAQAGLVGAVADCWRGAASGLVISSSRETDPSTGLSNVDRRLFRVEHGHFRRVWQRRAFQARTDFPEFRSPGAGLFASCRTRG
jgi:hypothetical protein